MKKIKNFKKFINEKMDPEIQEEKPIQKFRGRRNKKVLKIPGFNKY